MGHLISMLHFVRLTTLKAVEGLSTQELDFLMDAESNSIGMLLAHIAAVETWYQIATFLTLADSVASVFALPERLRQRDSRAKRVK